MDYISTRDGIWPMHIWDLKVYVTQYGYRDWRWTVFHSIRGSAVNARGKARSFEEARGAALTAYHAPVYAEAA